MSQTLQLPVRPHLQKYLVKKLRLTSDTIDVSLVDPVSFGLFTTAMLSQKREYYTSRNEAYVDKTVSSFTESFQLNLSKTQCNYFGHYFTNEKIFYINKFLNNSFINEMFCFIHVQIMFYPRVVISYAIDDFYSIFDIKEDDISKTTILRLYTRKKDLYSYLKPV